MKGFIASILLVPMCLSVASAQIPGIQEQPQWAMPFYFEDATGERDTIWIGCDPDAGNLPGIFDTLFEGWEYVDTTRFQAYLSLSSAGNPEDSAKKIEIIESNLLSFLNVQVDFVEGRMPIKVTWVDSLFYSDSLPFPDLDPAPRAKAIVSCNDLNPNYWNCPIDYEVLTLTDSIIPGMTYAYTDSLVLQGDTTWSPEESIYDLVIRIIPFDDFSYLGINNSQDELNIKVYPNPVSAELIMDNSQAQEIRVEVYRYDGKLIYISELDPLERRVLGVGDWPKGLYVVYLKMNNFIESHKIIKL